MKTLHKSFARRVGKTLSPLKKKLLESELPNYLFQENKIQEIFQNNREIILEIGFGTGEHFIYQLQKFPEKFFIGAEVYLHGVANILKFAKENNYTNFVLWPDSIDLIIKLLPHSSIETIYILFPDPWPKRKQIKKRLINEIRLNMLIDKLQKGGELIFASDIEDYFLNTKKLIEENNNLILSPQHPSAYPENYIPTKYHQKAIKQNMIAQFIVTKKI